MGSRVPAISRDTREDEAMTIRDEAITEQVLSALRDLVRNHELRWGIGDEACSNCIGCRGRRALAAAEA